MKLVVCFPGIGYHCDKPLLYYSRRLARADREVLVQYAYRKPGLRGNPAALRTALDVLYAQTEPQLAERLALTYDVTPEQAAADIAAMLRQMADNGFLEP